METLAVLEITIRRRVNRGQKLYVAVNDRETSNMHAWTVDPLLPSWREDLQRLFTRYGGYTAVLDGDWVRITK